MKYGTQTILKSIYPFIRKSDPPPSDNAKLRLKWIDYVYAGHSVKQCALHFDYPERTIRFWLNRYDGYRFKTLESKSTRPHNCRYSKVPLHHIERLISLRKKYPFGKVKLQVMLEREGILIGQTRIQQIINREGLRRLKKFRKKINRVNRRHMYSVPRTALQKIGGLIYFDVKHLYLPGGGDKVYQFTAIDHSTRTLYAKIYRRITSRSGSMFFEYVQEKLEHKISYVGSDNGSEFLGEFEELLSELKITHVFSSPRSPKQNPFVERVIRNIIDECYIYKGLASSYEKQEELIENYVHTYNYIRPHHSLNLETPNERYVKLLNKSRTT